MIYRLPEGDEMEEVLREYGDYLVGLGALVQVEKKAFPDFSSGFILAIGKRWYWTTEGHVIRDLQRRVEAGQSVSRFHLIDWYGTGNNENAIPFDYDNAWKYWVYNKEEGLDFGVVEVPTNVKDLLQANNVKAVEKSSDYRKRFGSYLMLGLPEDDVERELRQIPVGVNVRGRALPSAMHIAKTRCPKGHQKPHPRFVGRVGSHEEVGNIVGMSGCPIFGVKGATREVLALQSSWDDRSRVIFGCPLSVFVPMVEKAIRTKKAERLMSSDSPRSRAPLGTALPRSSASPGAMLTAFA
ncbi:MAG TPA: hypothetical protein VFG04_29390 [Planctomycetaceae bacterium]|jgi:hypothetical protein|nr:hypothetical protein [Planctomycetaceae bacterium]